MIPRAVSRAVAAGYCSLALALFLSGPARADVTPDVSVADEGRRADELNKQGQALAEAGKLDEALDVLNQAWKLKKAYDIAGNLALVEAAKGRPDLALEHVEFALHSFPTSGKPEHREMLEKEVTSLRAKVARVVLTGLSTGATVTVNGRAIGTAPIDTNVYAMPGDIALRVEHPDDEPIATTIAGSAGGDAVFAVELHPKKRVAGAQPVWPAVVGLSIAGAGLIVGVSTLVAAETAPLATCPNALECEGESDRQNNLRSASVWSFIVTGVAAGAGFGLLAWSVGRASSGGPKTSIQLAPALGGATFRTSF